MIGAHISVSQASRFIQYSLQLAGNQKRHCKTNQLERTEREGERALWNAVFEREAGEKNTRKGHKLMIGNRSLLININVRNVRSSPSKVNTHTYLLNIQISLETTSLYLQHTTRLLISILNLTEVCVIVNKQSCHTIIWAIIISNSWN